jgi:lambda family phage portal protein
MRTGTEPRATWLDRALGAVGLQRSVPQARRITSSGAGRGRVYHAAVEDRLTADLFAETLSGNDELKTDIRRLRGLSRRLMRDTASGRRFRNLVVEQTLGHEGVLLQARVEKRRGGRNVGLNAKLETEWHAWGRPGICSIDGRLSFQEVEETVMASIAIDGEALIRHMRGADNPWGYAVELLDPDLLDHTYTDTLPNGRRVVMGVEMDGYNRPVAYHLWNRHPSEFPDRRERIPASEIEHLFVVQRVGAVRGEPWASPVLTDASQLAAFLEAAVHAARVGASRVAAVERDKDVDMPDGWTPSATPDEVAPGQMLDLEPGARINALNWQYPTGEIDPFTKIIVRNLAVGLNVSYASLSGDLSDVNYSSIRAGLLLERDAWKKLQRFLIDRLHWPIYRAWRQMALLMGRLPARMNQQDYDHIRWMPRGWAWVDPNKEITAHEKALASRLTSRRRILAAQGMDLDEVLEELAEEEELLRDLGLAAPVAPEPEAAVPSPATNGEPPVRRIA